MKAVALTIRRKYFDAIVAGEKKEEIRADIPHWQWLLGDAPPTVAIFLCGRDIHFRLIKRIYTDFPEVVLGRPVSEQGRKDLRLEGNTLPQPCIIIELGDAMERKKCPRCDGKGDVPESEFNWILCPRCRGARYVYYTEDS